MYCSAAKVLMRLLRPLMSPTCFPAYSAHHNKAHHTTSKQLCEMLHAGAFLSTLLTDLHILHLGDPVPPVKAADVCLMLSVAASTLAESAAWRVCKPCSISARNDWAPATPVEYQSLHSIMTQICLVCQEMRWL